MRMAQSWMPAVLAIALGACSVEDTQDVNSSSQVETSSQALAGEVKPATGYYTVRHDQRRCVSPLCGGYFVATLNQTRTTCADGTRATECYVAEIDLPAGVTIEEGDLVQGELVPRSYPIANLAALKANMVLEPVVDGAVRGSHYLAFDSGIRCITTPCPSIGLTTLNTGVSYRGPSFAFAGKNGPDLEAAFYAELGSDADTGTGAVSVGTLRTRFDWRSRSYTRVLDVQNVYVAKRSVEPACVVLKEGQTLTAWNFASRAEADAFVAGLASADVQVLDSTCADASTICLAIYRPVHGSIDALGEGCVEESNSCAFRAAVIGAAGTEGKAQGTYSEGLCPSVTP